MSDKKCKAKKPDGTPCGAYAMRGNEFCYLHNPSITDEKKNASRAKGGANRALMTVEKALPAMPLETPHDAVYLIADTISRVRAGELDIKIANCIGVLSGQLIKALELAQLKDKVAYIERVVMTKRN
jgi:hypothetical protein